MNESGEKAFEPDDFDRIASSLVRHGVDFMVIGGFAVVFHGYVRATEDLDIFVRATQENALKTVAALQACGFSSPDLTPDVFLNDNGISLGEPPMKIDVISHLPGVSFEEAWERRQNGLFGTTTVNFIARQDLIKNKRAVGRPRDLDDVRELEDRA